MITRIFIILFLFVLSGCGDVDRSSARLHVDSASVKCDESVAFDLVFSNLQASSLGAASSVLEEATLFVRGGDIDGVDHDDVSFRMELEQGGLDDYSLVYIGDGAYSMRMSIDVACDGSAVDLSCQGFSSISKIRYPIYWIAVKYIAKDRSIFDAMESVSNFVPVVFENE